MMKKTSSKQRRKSMQYTYKTKGVGSHSIVVEMDGDSILKL